MEIFYPPQGLTEVSHFIIPSVQDWENAKDTIRAAAELPVKAAGDYDFFVFAITSIVGQSRRGNQVPDAGTISRAIVEAFTGILYPHDNADYVRGVQFEAIYASDDKEHTSVFIFGGTHQAAVSSADDTEEEMGDEQTEPESFTVTAYGETKKDMPGDDALFFVVQHLCANGISPEEILKTIPWNANRMFLKVEGEVDASRFAELASIAETSIGIDFDKDRWRCTEEELIHSQGSTYALRRPWGKRALKAMNALKEHFTEAGIEITNI